ncbi:MAG: crossover junction endodeoxyribonuclease RuvC [Candidatus Omnitrophica bacterium]|nr:crossover junction endodeoxyribonuclease RuvC [Candidatus Omnitrophota bacterium]
MIILGVDPGLDATGYGVIEVKGQGHDPVLIEAGLIRTQAGGSLAQRLMKIAQGVQTVLSQHRPDCISVEDLYSHYKTPEPAILMGHVRGVVLSTAAGAGVPVVSYLPTRVKKAVVGRGHASKEQVARMVQMRLGLKEGRVSPDVSDALAAALCHVSQTRAARVEVGSAG